MFVGRFTFQSVYGEEVNSQDSDYIITYLMRKFGRPDAEQNISTSNVGFHFKVRLMFIKTKRLEV